MKERLEISFALIFGIIVLGYMTIPSILDSGISSYEIQILSIAGVSGLIFYLGMRYSDTNGYNGYLFDGLNRPLTQETYQIGIAVTLVGLVLWGWIKRVAIQDLIAIILIALINRLIVWLVNIPHQTPPVYRFLFTVYSTV